MISPNITITGAHRLVYLCGIFSHLRNDPMVTLFNQIHNHPLNIDRPASRMLGHGFNNMELQSELLGEPDWLEFAQYVPDDAVKFYCGVTSGLEAPDNGSELVNVAFKDIQIIPGYYVMPFYEAMQTLLFFNSTWNTTQGDQYLGPDGETFYFPIFAGTAGDYLALDQTGTVYALSNEVDDNEAARWQPHAEDLVDLFNKTVDKLSRDQIVLTEDGVLDDLEESAEILDEHGTTPDPPQPRLPALRFRRSLRRIYQLAKQDARRIKRQTIGGVLTGTRTNIGGTVTGFNRFKKIVCKLPVQLPLVFPCEVMPDICKADEEGVRRTGRVYLRRHGDPKYGRKLGNRACRDVRKEVKKRKGKNWPKGKKYPLWCEEYPFRSTEQGGYGAYATLVPAEQNRLQGSVIWSYYSAIIAKRKACGQAKSGTRIKFWFRFGHI